MRKIQVRAHDGAAVLGMEPYQHFPLHCPIITAEIRTVDNQSNFKILL